MRRSLVVCSIFVLAVSACSSGPDRSLVVESIGNEAIIPNLDDAVTGFENLDATVTVYCNELSPRALTAAQASWRAAKLAWEPAQPNTYFDTGDADRVVSKVDYEPASSEGIERLLESDAVIDTNYVENNAASTQRGLGSIEHLLFSREGNDERSCTLLEGSATVALDAVRNLRNDWTNTYDGLAPFIDQFTEDMTDREALGDVVSAIVETLKRQTLFEIGAALGISSPETQPGALEEGAAGEGAATYLAQMEGIESWLVAGGETSLIELIRSQSEEVATEIESEIEAAKSVLASIDEPLQDVAVDDPDRLRPLFDSLDRLRTLFEADVVSLLDVGLGFSDSDGDSG